MRLMSPNASTLAGMIESANTLAGMIECANTLAGMIEYANTLSGIIESASHHDRFKRARTMSNGMSSACILEHLVDVYTPF